MAYLFCGTHVIADFYGVSQTIYMKDLLNTLKESCARNRLTLVDFGTYEFDNGGFTLFFLLAESHISFHYYCEKKAAFVDVFTCGKNDPMVVLDDLKRFCKPEHINTKYIKRGTIDV